MFWDFFTLNTLNVLTTFGVKYIQKNVSYLNLFTDVSLLSWMIINSSQKDVEVFCVACTIMYRINNPSAKYVDLEKTC